MLDFAKCGRDSDAHPSLILRHIEFRIADGRDMVQRDHTLATRSVRLVNQGIWLNEVSSLLDLIGAGISHGNSVKGDAQAVNDSKSFAVSPEARVAAPRERWLV